MRTSQNKNSDRHSSEGNLVTHVELQDSKSKTNPKNSFTAAVYCKLLQKSCEKHENTAETADLALRFATESNLKYVKLL